MKNENHAAKPSFIHNNLRMTWMGFEPGNLGMQHQHSNHYTIQDSPWTRHSFLSLYTR